MKDRDRKLVLERRALFIGSSLAALGCAPNAPAEGPVPVTLAEPRQVGEDGSREAGPVTRPPRLETTAELSYDVPAGVTDATRERYARLFSSMKSGHEILGRAEPLVPRPCQPTDPSCRQALSAIADELNDFRRVMTFLYFCPGSSDEAKEFERIQAEHRQRLELRVGKLESAIVEGIVAAGSNQEAWDEILREAYDAKPYPCLSYACRDDW